MNYWTIFFFFRFSNNSTDPIYDYLFLVIKFFKEGEQFCEIFKSVDIRWLSILIFLLEKELNFIFLSNIFT